MRYYIIIPILSFLMPSCKNSNENKQASDNSARQTIVPVKNTVIENTELQMPADNGQQYFKVAVTKNNQPLAQYEGDFPVPLFADNSFTLQLPANKGLLKISHLLVLYFNSPSVGSFPIAPWGNEKGKPTLIFTPEAEGSYGVGIPAATGTVVISKYSDKIVSGSIDAAGKDTDGNTINIRAAFVNLKNNDLNK